MMLKIAKYITTVLVYLGFFIVQMGSNNLIQENIRFSNAESAFGNNHTQKNSGLKLWKQNAKIKKAYLNRRFYPSYTKEVICFKTSQFIYYASNKINSTYLSARIQKSKYFGFEDRGPPVLI